MEDFVHLHVHTQYSLLDGQASVPRLVDKAIADGMRGMAITDHGNMMGVKEFFNYTNKKNGALKAEVKSLGEKLKKLQEADKPDNEAIRKTEEEQNLAQSEIGYKSRNIAGQIHDFSGSAGIDRTQSEQRGKQDNEERPDNSCGVDATAQCEPSETDTAIPVTVETGAYDAARSLLQKKGQEYIDLTAKGGKLYLFDEQIAQELSDQGYKVYYAKNGTKKTAGRPAWYL